MKFVLPCKECEHSAREFIQEFYDHSSKLNGTGGLDGFLIKSTYLEWLDKIARDMDIANIPPDRVAAFTYFYVRQEDNRIIGMINIRLALNDFLRKEGGHIGYCIRPTERKKGYGTMMLKESLVFCDKIGLCKIIISCDKNNPASTGVIKNCGGILDAEFYSEIFNEVVQRYTITI